MRRREFMILSAASVAVPVAGWAGTTGYRPGLALEELAVGKTVFLDFTTT